MELQPALCQSDPYVCKMVNGRKLGSARRGGVSKSEKCTGLALPRKVKVKRDEKAVGAHMDELNWLSATINGFMGITLSSTEVPPQKYVVAAITYILSRHDYTLLIPFGFYIGELWTKDKLPDDCNHQVWTDIQLVAKICASYESCVRRGSVMGTIVGELGYSQDGFLPPFLGDDNEYTGNNHIGDEAVNMVMYGNPHGFSDMMFAPELIMDSSVSQNLEGQIVESQIVENVDI
jgi:hypothetical protein